jgi:glutathione synthase/RimK-type ligase-like ATP-grasp enzyme
LRDGSQRGVLVVAPAGDSHGDAVEKALARQGVAVVRGAVDATAAAGFSVDPGRCVKIGGNCVTSGWAVWWHRLGNLPPLPGADAEEQTLAADEARALFVGGLLALDLAWVDEPAAVERAEHTLLQLATARACGADVPDTIATSDLAIATMFLGSGPVVAKAVSSGAGLAPFATAVSPAMLPGLVGAPTLLQRLVPAVADLRLVVVGHRVLGWRRERNDVSPVDWRAADPSGSSFSAVDLPWDVQDLADRICAALGLSTAVQDWVVDEMGRNWFLEVNPVGRWLFLPGADATIPGLLADHLAHRLRSPT